MPRMAVENALGVGEVYFQGAHVTGWQPAGAAEPVLWRSRLSMFQQGKPIRGGVPICFPWFGAHAVDPSLPAHGFARILDWRLIDAREDAAGTVTLAMELAGEDLSPGWPHRFRAVHRITFGEVLRMDLEVHNLGAEPFTYEEALHTYVGVRDIRAVTVTGLEATEYLDKVGGLEGRLEGAVPVRFTGETDRIYVNTQAACVIHDPGVPRKTTVSKAGSDATVLWNPWIAKSRSMPDFGDDEWTGMLCVETCNVQTHARTLAPGASHTMTAVVEARDLQD